MNTRTQPSFFISHGSPMMAVENSATSNFIAGLDKTIEKPDAIIVFSAHFDLRKDIVITSGLAPKTIHDFYGFPQELYDIKYPASGSPELAKKIANRFESYGLKPILSDEQGWDHGVWIPLILMYPDADIPVVQVSINSLLGAEVNYRYGEILSDFRDNNILIIGSGGISHNLREVFNPVPDKDRVTKVTAFTDWINNKLLQQDKNAMFHYLDEAPFTQFNHPSQDHFLPLMAAWGASNAAKGERIHQGMEFEILALDAFRFD
ncbi:DODA-type extradiol aromatic ring-opening family dioxygenase [Vibrio salinus]|uniref:DODA-type extradiol aromatic ring-opening family dioxygenase n=1 Tax=Vibrio salinus TaxID=2899784 RepID=UPI001E5D4547|nr:class III extradiol ring-cleavage dioxygenase [Vibrio salinus]MCE0495978.1 dioxygenase [Vibrio salinus]